MVSKPEWLAVNSAARTAPRAKPLREWALCSMVIISASLSYITAWTSFLRRVPAFARSPQIRDKLSRSDLWTKCPEIGSLRCFPCRGIPFRTVIWFSRCSSSMNYHKSTLFRPPVPYIHKVGNHLGKLAISTLSELW